MSKLPRGDISAILRDGAVVDFSSALAWSTRRSSVRERRFGTEKAICVDLV
jgi:Ethanolamine utilization protein EutJ (predicted chaperonin)